MFALIIIVMIRIVYFCFFVFKLLISISMAGTHVSEETRPLIQSNAEEARPQERSNEDTRIEEQCHPTRDQRSRITKYLVALCIMFVELCERLTFYGIAVNMVFYCQNVLMLSSPLPSTIALAFQGN